MKYNIFRNLYEVVLVKKKNITFHNKVNNLKKILVESKIMRVSNSQVN